MANEITLTIQLDIVKDKLIDQIRKSGLKFDLASGLKSGGIQSIGFAAAEAVVISADIATPGYAYFRNMDATNYVVLSTNADATVPFCKLLAGQVALLPLGVTAIYAKADAAAISLEYQVYAA